VSCSTASGEPQAERERSGFDADQADQRYLQIRHQSAVHLQQAPERTPKLLARRCDAAKYQICQS
jgi:hypothetical protein